MAYLKLKNWLLVLIISTPYFSYSYELSDGAASDDLNIVVVSSKEIERNGVLERVYEGSVKGKVELTESEAASCVGALGGVNFCRQQMLSYKRQRLIDEAIARERGKAEPSSASIKAPLLDMKSLEYPLAEQPLSKGHEAGHVASAKKGSFQMDGAKVVTMNGTVVGPVKLSDEENKSCIGAREGYSLCRRNLLLNKRIEMVKNAVSEADQSVAAPSIAPRVVPVPTVKPLAFKPEVQVSTLSDSSVKAAALAAKSVFATEASTVQVTKLPVEEKISPVIGVESVAQDKFKPWNILTSSDDEICDFGVKEKIMKSKEKCLSSINEDKKEKFEIARDAYLSAIENEREATKEARYKECESINESATKRKYCKEGVREELGKLKKEKENDFDVAYSIASSEAERIDHEYEKQFDAIKLEKCGRAPIGHQSIRDDADQRIYRNCVSKEKRDFYSQVKEEKDQKISKIAISDTDYNSVKYNCSKGLFNFVTNNYDECIQDKLERKPASVASGAPKAKSGDSSSDKKEAAIDCDDLVNKEINELLKEDNENIIGRLYQITSLKIAKQIMDNMGEKKYPNESLENYISKQKKLHSSEQAQKVLELYRDNGRLLDAKFIEDNIVKSPSNYKNARLDNDNVSAFILADIYSNSEKTNFNELDAATAWFMGRVGENSPFKVGSSGSNLMNMSVLVYRNLNLLSATPEEANNRINRVLSEQDGKIKELFSTLKTNVETKLASQCGEYFESPCWNGGTDVFNKKMARSFIDLGKNINGIEVKQGLSGSINGKYKFNFLAAEFRN